MRKRISYPALAVVVALAALLCAAGASAARSKRTSASPRSFSFSGEEIAPPSTCPGQTATDLSASEQVGVMLCLTNYARGVDGMRPLSPSRRLGRAAEQKSADIVGCDEFSHEACGRPFQFWIQRYGYLKGCSSTAENIA